MCARARGTEKRGEGETNVLVCRSLKSPDGNDLHHSETQGFELEEMQGTRGGWECVPHAQKDCAWILGWPEGWTLTETNSFLLVSFLCFF